MAVVTRNAEANRMASTLADLERRLRAVETGSQLGRSAIVINGQSMTLADSVRETITATESVAQAVAIASSAAAKVDGVVNTFYTDGGTPPSGARLGDFWVRRDNKNVAMWDGDSWEPVTSAEIKNALIAAADAKAAADGKISTFFQASPPTGAGEGDIWFDTDDRNRQYRWDGTQWVSVRDGAVTDALDAAADASNKATTAVNAANGKNRVVYSLSDPNANGTAPGDTWFKTNVEGYIYGQWRWDGSNWIPQTLTDAVISTLTAGKIVSGTLTAGTKITAGTPGADRVEISSEGIRAYDGNDLYANMGQGAFYFRGQIDAERLRSFGYNARGEGYLEIGDTGDNDPVDEVRMFTTNGITKTVTSMRNPRTNVGSIRFSMGDTQPNTWNSILDIERFQIRSNQTNYGFVNQTGAGLYADGNRPRLMTGGGYQLELLGTGDAHTMIRSQQAGLKFLNSQPHTIQVRTSGDSDYARIVAGTVNYVYSFGQTSNPRFKNNLTPVNLDALALLRNVSAYIWDWNTDTSGASGPGFGMLTTEVPALATVQSEVGPNGAPETYSMDRMMTLAIQAIRQLESRVEQLEG